MTVYGSQILQRSQTQHGKPYRFGAEVQIGLTWFFQAKAWDCLTADTIVHTARGPVRIDEVEVGDAVWSWDEANLRPHKIERVEERPASPVFRLRTRSRSIRATADHRLLVLRRDRGNIPVNWRAEWVPMRDIERGDVVVTLDSHPAPDQEMRLPNGVVVNDDVAWLLGVFLGDGNLRRGGFDICVFGDQRERVADVLERVVGVRGTPTDKNGLIVNSVEWAAVVAEVGFPVGTTASTKRVPSIIPRLGASGQRAFLAGYAFADGHLDGRGHQTYSSCSRALVAEVRALHIGLGDNVSNLTEMKRTKPIVINGVTVKNAQPLWSFAWYPDSRRVNSELLDTYGARRALPDRAFSAQPVLAVTPDGTEATWDIEVEGSHNFAANGLIVHNCSELTEGTHGSFGVYLPDGSSAQADHVKRISIAEAKRIPGALLGHPPKGSKPGHVVHSVGDGKHTSEAMGRAYGVRQGNIDGRGFTWGGLVPGVTYGPEAPKPVPTPPPGSPAALQQAIFFAKHFQIGKPGVELNADVIRFVQEGINNWADNFAKWTGSPNPADIAVNGIWDDPTRFCVALIQNIIKVSELGTVGPATWEALYPTRP